MKVTEQERCCISGVLTHNFWSQAELKGADRIYMKPKKYDKQGQRHELQWKEMGSPQSSGYRVSSQAAQIRGYQNHI